MGKQLGYQKEPGKYHFTTKYPKIAATNTHSSNSILEYTWGKGPMKSCFFVGPLQRVRPRNGILGLVVVVLVPLRSEFIGEL